MGVKEQSEGLERAIDHMCRKTRDLRRQLRKAVVDHVSDSFLETSVPLLVLIEAARNGRDKEVEEYALVFTEHANKLVEVSPVRLKQIESQMQNYILRWDILFHITTGSKPFNCSNRLPTWCAVCPATKTA